MWRPMLVAAASTYCMSAEPSSSGGVPTPMNCSVPWPTACGHVGGELQPARRHVALHHLLQAGLEDGHVAVVQDADLAFVHIQAHHVVAHLGQAGARHQAHIAVADDSHLHACFP
jgi:hypothetical protein